MKKVILAVILLWSFKGFSQKQDLGKVTIEELKEKACPRDTSAVAAVLFNIGKTSFEYSYDAGFEIVTEIMTKVKVYKKEGYDFANKSFKYYNNGGVFEKVTLSKAVTYNLAGDKIEKTKLSGDGEFNEKISKEWSVKKITMPNVKEGSIIEYKIEIRSPFIYNFPEWEFQKTIPVNYSSYSTYIPEYYIYNTHLKGVFAPKIETETKPRKIQYSYIDKAMPGMVNGHGDERVHSELNFTENITRYTLADLPALKNEAYVNNMDNYISSLLHELAGKRFPNSPYENYTTDWESVVKKVFEMDNFGNELNKTGYFEKDVDALLTGLTTPEDKIAAIFNYVKSRMNWTEYYGIFCDDGVKKAYQNKKGNAAEINLMLTAMFRYAGFDANPILISTRSNGVSLYPSTSAYDFVISGIELQNQVVLFDATDKNSLPDILPIRDLNWFGRIIRKNASSAEIDLMPKANSKDITNIMASINDKGEVSGKIREQYFDYYAFLFRDNNSNVSKESYIEKMEKRHPGLEISEYDVQNNKDLSKPIVENYSFTTNNAIEIIGDKMYVSPFLFFAQTENPFKQETREYPIDFIFPNQDKFNVSLNLPAGYVVETLPQPKSIGMPDNMGSFKYAISNNGTQVQLMYTSDMNEAIIGAEKYEVLKSFFKEIVNKQTEKIVLKKV